MRRHGIAFRATVLHALWLGLLSLALTGAEQHAATRTPLDDSGFRSAGIRKLTSRHLTLYTDLESSPQIDRLPEDFDRAVPEWAKYFGMDAAQAASWTARAFLIGDRRRFDALGLMPVDHDDFVNGVSVGTDFWFYDQPSEYYRRHLMLHEGSHAFMRTFLGDCGPGWYMEGMAELLATHRFDARGRLELGIMPRNRKETPMLGRIKLIREAFQEGRLRSLPEVLQTQSTRQLDNESYAWCWALAKLLESHPRYGERFTRLAKHTKERDFNRIVRELYAEDWPSLLSEWSAYIATLDYGFDYDRMAIRFERGRALGTSARRVAVDADRGWQSSGVWLEAGQTYRIDASGRFQIAVENGGTGNQAWPCEPGGVTIEYHRGRPLGMLLGAIEAPDDWTSLARPFSIGLGTVLTPTTSGTLYLRVNDAPAKLGDNRGQLQVKIARSTPGNSSG